MPAPTYRLSPDGQSITCLICHVTSYNPNDARERYCAVCHRFHDDEEEVLLDYAPVLFDVPELLSPRAKWMREHDIHVSKFDVDIDDSSALAREPWNAWQGDLEAALRGDKVAHGATELAALLNLAVALGIPSW